MIIKQGKGKRQVAYVYLLQRRQVEAVLHSCSEALWEILPQESRLGVRWKYDAFQQWEHGQKRGNFFQIGCDLICIVGSYLQDSDVFRDPGRLGDMLEQIGRFEAVPEIGDFSASVDDDAMEPMSLNGLREDWVGF